MLHHGDESAEHLVRRLESFSDIVIAFSLAELTLNLSIPARVEELWHRPLWLSAYVWTFAVVSSLWYSHHRLFVRAFVPAKLAIFLNFVWLATVGLLVYLMQVSTHLWSDEHATRTLYNMYFGLYGVNIAVTAALYLIGSSHRTSLDEAARLDAARRAEANGIAAATVFASIAIAAYLPTTVFFWVVPSSIGVGFFFAWLWHAARKFGRPTAAAER